MSWLDAFDTVFEQINAGDNRAVLYERVVRCLEEAGKEKGKMSGKKSADAIDMRRRKFVEMVIGRNDHDKIKRPFNDLLSRVSNVCEEEVV